MQFYKPRNWARSIQPKISVSPIHIWKPWIDWMRVLDQNDKISDYLIRKSNLISSEDGENQNEKKNHSIIFCFLNVNTKRQNHPYILKI